MKNAITIFFLLILLTICAHATNPFPARVTQVHDGDTCKIAYNHSTATIRLYGIDAPELAQSYGQEAAIALRSLCAVTTVSVTALSRDRYHRTIGIIRLPNGQSINNAMVAQGAAWWYAAYAKQDVELQRLETQARHDRRGLWQDTNPLPPWEFRKGLRARYRPPQHR